MPEGSFAQVLARRREEGTLVTSPGATEEEEKKKGRFEQKAEERAAPPEPLPTEEPSSKAQPREKKTTLERVGYAIAAALGGPEAIIAGDPEAQKAAAPWFRLMAETGAGVGATVLTRGKGAPAAGARMKAAAQVAMRSLKIGGAEAAASLESELADPSEEPLKRAAVTGTIGAATDFVTGGGIGAVRGGTKMVRGGQEAVEDILTARKAGLTEGIVSVGQASQSRLYDTLESIARGSLLGGGVITEGTGKAADFQRRVIRNFADEFAGKSSREGVEDLVSDTIAGRGDAFREVARRTYDGVDILKSDVGVDLGPILDEARRLAKQGLGDPQMNRVVRALEKKIDDLGSTAASSVPFSEAAAIRSDLLGIGRGGAELIKGKAVGAGKRLSGMLDTAMEKAAKNLSGEALEAWRNANKFWKDGIEVFNSRLVRNLTKQDPQSVYSAAIKNRSPREIRKVRELILEPSKFGLKDTPGDPKLWQEVQGQWLMDAIDKGTPAKEGGELAGKKFGGVLKKLGDDAMKELFPKAADREELKRAARSLEIYEGGIGEGIPGRIFIQLQQAAKFTELGGALLGFGNVVSPTESVAIMLAPAGIARLFTTPSFVKWATIGNTVKPGTEQATRALAQMTAMALAEGGRVLQGDDADKAIRAGRRERLPKLTGAL